MALAREADVTIAVVGLSQQIEGEEGQREGVAEGRSAGDRTDLALPGVQGALLQALHETGTPLVVVLLNDSALSEQIAPGETLRVVATVENTGERAGEEVVQLYLRDVAASVRVHLAPGQAQEVTFALEPRQMAAVLEDGWRVIEPGDFEIFVGGGQPGADAPGVGSAFEVVGEPHPLT